MSYIIYKLKFPNGIHIATAAGLGSTALSIRSDRFYSALYTEYMNIYNNDDLYELSRKGEFLISDLFPFKNADLYLPKPFVSIERKTNIRSTVDRKKVKSLSYMPADRLQEYFEFLKTGENFPEIDDDFGKKQLYTKNKISLNGEDTQLYNVEVFNFNEYSGLYFIVNLPNDEWIEIFENLLDSLSLTGIGGKKTSGYGQFRLDEDPMFLYEDDYEPIESESDAYINRALHSTSKNYITLSSYIPLKEEISKLKEEKNFYNIVKNSGFVNLKSYSNQAQKRKQIYMISSGSTLNFRAVGDIVDLKLHGEHSIYKMGKPMLMGVDLWEK